MTSTLQSDSSIVPRRALPPMLSYADQFNYSPQNHGQAPLGQCRKQVEKKQEDPLALCYPSSGPIRDWLSSDPVKRNLSVQASDSFLTIKSRPSPFSNFPNIPPVGSMWKPPSPLSENEKLVYPPQAPFRTKPLSPALSSSSAEHGGNSFKCGECGKVYKHLNCLTKHKWEHSEYWTETSKLSLSKHQQVQMMEAAQILMQMEAAGRGELYPIK